MFSSKTTQHSAASPPREIKNPLESEEFQLIRFKGDSDQCDYIIAAVKSAIPELPLTDYYTEFASRIQKSLCKKPGGIWNCIVGANFSLNTKSIGDLFCQMKIGPYVNVIVYTVRLHSQTVEKIEDSEKESE